MEEEYLDSDNLNGEEFGDSLTRVSGMYKDWFLDYASYVILERSKKDSSFNEGFR